MLIEVKFEMAPLRHAVHILPDVSRVARESADPGDTSMFAPLEPGLTMMADDLGWWGGALGRARDAGRA